jgi:hypothetical protein
VSVGVQPTGLIVDAAEGMAGGTSSMTTFDGFKPEAGQKFGPAVAAPAYNIANKVMIAFF